MLGRPPRSAFTLIELLVVVTIIVVLLALLTPAMDRAVYQAELAACGAKLKAIGGGATTYAMANTRHYPVRDGAADVNDVWYPFLLRDGAHDERPSLAKALDINQALNDPAAGSVDLLTQTTTYVFTSYNLWFSWRYDPNGPDPPPAERGMFKVGDRWVWDGRDYDVIASDHDRIAATYDASLCSHPDDWRVMDHASEEDSAACWIRWQNLAALRGPTELNYAYDDGSVRRWAAVKGRDDRMVMVPDRNDAKYQLDWWATVPSR